MSDDKPKPLHKMGEEELTDYIEQLKDKMRPNHIKVADAVLAGESQRKAYWNAYNPGQELPESRKESTDANASLLISSHKVQQYLKAMRHQESRANDLTLQVVIRAQADIARRARAAGDFGNERQALAEVSRLLDHYPSEKREVLLKGEGLTDLSEAEWHAIFQATDAEVEDVRH